MRLNSQLRLGVLYEGLVNRLPAGLAATIGARRGSILLSSPAMSTAMARLTTIRPVPQGVSELTS